jgi:hypothetical protein
MINPYQGFPENCLLLKFFLSKFFITKKWEKSIYLFMKCCDGSPPQGSSRGTAGQRYLIQLNEIALLDQTIIKGENVWLPRMEILKNVIMEDSILSPIQNMFIDFGAIV